MLACLCGNNASILARIVLEACLAFADRFCEWDRSRDRSPEWLRLLETCLVPAVASDLRAFTQNRIFGRSSGHHVSSLPDQVLCQVVSGSPTTRPKRAKLLEELPDRRLGFSRIQRGAVNGAYPHGVRCDPVMHRSPHLGYWARGFSLAPPLNLYLPLPSGAHT